MPPEPRRVLLSDATSYKAVVLAAFIKRHHPGIEVLTCDERPASAFLHTRFSDRHFVLRHGAKAPAPFIEEMLRLVRDARADLLLPVNSREMDALMPAKEGFGAAMAYWGGLEAYLSLHRKDRLHALARSLSLRVPTRFETLETIRLPAVAKPMNLSAAKGVVYLRDLADVERFRATQPDWASFLIQEHISGEGLGFSVFAREGRILAGYGHRRLVEFPVSGGSSVYREGLDDARVRDVAARLIEETRWSGFAMFEFKRTRENDMFLIEANPRVWGSIHQPLAAGVDMLEPLFGPAQMAKRQDVRTYFSPVVYAALLGQLLLGRTAPAWEFARSFPRNRADVPLHRDPLAWLGAFLRVG